VQGNRVDSPVEAHEPDLAIGARIGRYVILERVGSGAMGVVYGAYDPELDRKIALKLLRGVGAGAGPLAGARMMREAKAMARLSHPNVAAVHDVGLYDGQVFLATEFLSGGTVRDWLEAAPRGWRAIVAVFIAAGRGLTAAHAAGLVHRDFKPDNVLLDKEGRARVVDFGLARNVETTDSQEANEPPPPKHDPNAATGVDLNQTGRLDKLTRTGALMGTPAYMAPEQFMGEATDERTDQFSFCVALYEALYGERPFEGETVLSLSVSVTEGQIRPMPKDRDVPTWIRRTALRGLRTRREDRYPSMVALIAALEDDPAIRQRRRLVAAGLAGIALASVLVARQIVTRRRVEVDRRVTAAIDEAVGRAKAARADATKVRELRRWAFEAFDALDPERGESLWHQTLTQGTTADAEYLQAEQAFETALVLDAARAGAREQMADVLVEHLSFARELRIGDRVRALSESLARNDPQGTRRASLTAPGILALHVQPPPISLTLERFESDPATDLRIARPGPAVTIGETPLPPGSYRLTARGPGLAEVLFPFEIEHGARLALTLTVPAVAKVPEGFAYVPAGAFWYGDADERLRTEFLNAVPLHRRQTGPYLIARHETTYGDWIAFLEALPAAERQRHLPDASASVRGFLRLQGTPGNWQLTLQTAPKRYVVRSGEPFVYVGRKMRERQDWLRFPVSGILAADAERYVAWLNDSGRVPGARLCTEVEWERAARGADDRVYPHSETLQPDDANFDVTYGRVDSAYGPDMVGSHPRSRSPFAVDDMVGNVFEFARSSQQRDETVIRGGAYYFGAASCRSTNREVVPPTFREITAGLRVCASIDLEKPDAEKQR
jgi:formylglycine-generating enzyme required for sulfatase activity